MTLRPSACPAQAQCDASERFPFPGRLGYTRRGQTGDHRPILHWLPRDADLGAAAGVPFRLLAEESALSFGANKAGGGEGDNLEALKALLPFYAGRVKCIYIDSPYNTRSAFEHYDDNLEHSRWLGIIVPRLTLLREFLSDDGSILVSIGDNERNYLKVGMSAKSVDGLQF